MTLGRARVSVTGPGDPETVWRRYAEPRLWSTWSPQIRSVDYPHPTLRSGTSGTVRTLAGVGIPFVVEEVSDRDRTWTWRVRVGVLTLRLTHEVLPAEPRGSTTCLEVVGPPLLAPAYARVATIALRRLVRE